MDLSLPEAELAHLLSPLALAVTATAEMPSPYVYAPHLHRLSSELVALRSREPGHPKRLAVTMPPRHGKSEMCSHWFPVWDLALEPKDRIILCSYEAQFAAKWGRSCRRSIQEHYPILGARVVTDSRAAHRWETTQGGGMVTAGVGGPITGRGGDVMILDDPIKNAEEANSQIIRDNLWDWWQTTFLTRCEPEAVIVVIMTRWHEDDLLGRLLNSSEAKYWRTINFPAVAEEHEDSLERSPGQALWPERYDELALENIKAEVGSRVFTALYQQRPAPPEGVGLQRNWWRWYDELPDLETFDQIIMSVDPTFKDVDTADFFVAMILGRLGNEYYGIDCVRKRLGPVDQMKAIRQLSDQWPQAKVKLIEETAAGTAIIDLMQREIPGKIIPVKVKAGKEIRLHWGVSSVAGKVESGKCFLPRGRAWAGTLVDEGASFPHAVHDDMVDAFTQGIQYLMPRSWVWENMEKRKAAAKQPDNLLELHTHKMHEAVKRKMKDLVAGERKRSRQGTLWPGL